MAFRGGRPQLRPPGHWSHASEAEREAADNARQNALRLPTVDELLARHSGAGKTETAAGGASEGQETAFPKRTKVRGIRPRWVRDP
jgi:hypothetical protein